MTKKPEQNDPSMSYLPYTLIYADMDAKTKVPFLIDMINMADATFQSLTRLATKILDVPIAYIGLLSDETNWIEAGIGLEFQSCDRAVSFCDHAIREPDVLLVPDTLKDPRFMNNMMVTGPSSFRFYAGAVIRGPQQEPVATICVIDTQPRAFSARQIDMLRDIRDVAQDLMRNYIEKRMRHKEILLEAKTDKVTGLLNEAGLQERLEYEVQWASRSEGAGFGVLMIEIIGFNAIKRGHERVLRETLLANVGGVLTKSLPEGCIHGRWRESIFMSIVSGTASADELVKTATRVVSAFETPLFLNNISIPLRVRIGISRFPFDAQNTYQVIEAAEQALDDISLNNETCYSLADVKLNSVVMERLDLERRLYRAIEHDELDIVYQPKINTKDNQVVGAEALVRWTDPELGVIPPYNFIPIAENAGLIDRLGSSILRKACQIAATWDLGLAWNLTIAVNVSAIQLQNSNFPQTVTKALKISGLDPHRLILEVTESALIAREQIVVANMQAIVAMGVRFSIDDFGMGYTNFDYIRKLPIHSIKIDKTFVSRITDSEKDARICQAIIAMGRSLDMVVIAEGVETKEQLVFLKAYRCDQLQGFYFSKPLSDHNFRLLFQDQVNV